MFTNKTLSLASSLFKFPKEYSLTKIAMLSTINKMQAALLMERLCHDIFEKNWLISLIYFCFAFRVSERTSVNQINV